MPQSNQLPQAEQSLKAPREICIADGGGPEVASACSVATPPNQISNQECCCSASLSNSNSNSSSLIDLTDENWQQHFNHDTNIPPPISSSSQPPTNTNNPASLSTQDSSHGHQKPERESRLRDLGSFLLAEGGGILNTSIPEISLKPPTPLSTAEENFLSNRFLFLTPFTELTNYCSGYSFANMLSLPTKYSKSSFNIKRSYSSTAFDNSSDDNNNSRNSSSYNVSNVTNSNQPPSLTVVPDYLNEGLNCQRESTNFDSVIISLPQNSTNFPALPKGRVRFKSESSLNTVALPERRPSKVYYKKKRRFNSSQSAENLKHHPAKPTKVDSRTRLHSGGPSGFQPFRSPRRSITENFTILLSKLNLSSDDHQQQPPQNEQKTEVSNQLQLSRSEKSSENISRDAQSIPSSIFSKLNLKKSANSNKSTKITALLSQTQNRSFLFSSLAAKYATNRMSCKCIVAADNEKTGRIISDRIRKLKHEADKKSDSESASDSDEGRWKFIDEVVYSSLSQSLLRKSTTTIVKIYELTEYMEMLDMSVENVVILSFYGCYGNDMDFVPAKKVLENALLEMGMPYDDSDLETKDSRRILYNTVILR
ncbi:uncharacterized protein LOC142334590 [Convolutriloba macropyga]|uniref:uncharacterized protein LOC142334590 n=1 Tax=Convolutriloba macropyga TaxID=536237 RepID=UPI003F51DFD5